MIGKISQLDFNKLFFLLLVSLSSVSYFFKNYFFVLIFVISFLVSFFISKNGLKIIKKVKVFQKIREEGPASHKKKKINIPTMGGIFIIIPYLFLIIFINIFYPSNQILILSFTIFCFFLIGLLDDFLSIKNESNMGLNSNQKFLLQVFISILFITFSIKGHYISSDISILNKWTINAEKLIIPISIITLIGYSNAVNLTDGLDGLAAGCSSIVLFGLGTEILLKNNKELIIYSVLSYSLCGLCMGFLKLNQYPAKIFMGDTGSLSIGAIIGSICILTDSFFTTTIISGVFILETLSVIIQVSFFKITKKIFNSGRRVFLMTPIHHHFELKGFNEEEIVENFWKVNIILVILSIVLKMSF